jgi:hypothetical protein
MRTKWGKNYNKPTKSFIKNQAMNKLKESLKQILIDTLNVPCGYIDVSTHSKTEELLYKEKIEPVRKQTLDDYNEITKNLPRKKKKKLRKSYQEFKQIW